MNNGDKIKKLRKELKLSQQELASMIGVTQSSIYLWEKGTRKPKLEQIIKLSEVLGVPLKYFGYETIGVNGSSEILYVGDDKDLLRQNKLQSNFLKYLDSLGYEFIYGDFYDSPIDEVGMIQIKGTDTKIPLTLIEVEQLEDTISQNIELEIYRLMKKKNI